MEGCKFTEDILVEILCWLLKKSLARFKCVSKQWFGLISDCSHVFPKRTHVGLVCQAFLYPRLTRSVDSNRTYKDSRLFFFSVDPNDKGRAHLKSSHLHYDTEQSLHELLCSCNGFLLFCNFRDGDGLKFLVYYPASKRSWHIPFHPKDQHFKFIGLASDGNYFKVVCLTRSADCKSIRLWVYSSQNQEWLEQPLSFSITIPEYMWNMTLDREPHSSVLLEVPCIGFGHVAFLFVTCKMGNVRSATFQESTALYIYKEEAFGSQKDA